jgi:hypothetical protein
VSGDSQFEAFLFSNILNSPNCGLYYRRIEEVGPPSTSISSKTLRPEELYAISSTITAASDNNQNEEPVDISWYRRIRLLFRKDEPSSNSASFPEIGETNESDVNAAIKQYHEDSFNVLIHPEELKSSNDPHPKDEPGQWSSWLVDLVKSEKDPLQWHAYRARKVDGAWDYQTDSHSRDPFQT